MRDDKLCGDCLYADYYRRGGRELTSAHTCEVYTKRVLADQKGCRNWRRKEDENHHRRG